MEQQSTVNVLVIWRGKQLIVEVDSDSTIKDFGLKLQKLTNAKSDTMRLLVPQSKSSKLITPFSDEHSSLSLRDISILEGKPIRMMGASDYEIEEVSHSSSKADLRIIGFDEEEKRMRQRSSRPETALRLPTGPYIFCDFHTLHIPGIELNPPASEALKRMHMLACDPGIIAIMNKHHWRVGIMTELAPVGYVGISPKCLLGFNKNHGEEISLRLRTDDLKGFRKYESIKKTLLHELAHMVYSEHDADFYALDKQLNKEAESLDWTKSRSHSLSGRKVSVHHEEDIPLTSASDYRGQKLGGASDTQLATARAASVAAAYHRLLNSPANCAEVVLEQSSHTDAILAEGNHIANKDDVTVPENDDIELKIDRGEIYAKPDPDDAISVGREKMHDNMMLDEPVSGDCFEPPNVQELDLDDCHAVKEASRDEPDPDDSLPEPTKSSAETELDDLIAKRADAKLQRDPETGPSDAGTDGIMEDKAPKGVSLLDGKKMELDSDSSQAMGTVKVDPHPDDSMDGWDSEELKVIEEPVSAICSRLQRAIKLLRSEAPPAEATSALQTLFKIIRNVIDHPNDVKFRRFRKANPSFQRNVANYKAAMEFLTHIGFCEDVISDEFGRAETYLVLKRNDPGLLWLAKSSLEVSIP